MLQHTQNSEDQTMRRLHESMRRLTSIHPAHTVKTTEIPMGGIQFLTDEKGNKTAAVIDLRVHKALWEDIQDLLVSRSRRSERSVPLAKVKASLVASGKLRG
jgi:hypothetical protein